MRTRLGGSAGYVQKAHKIPTQQLSRPPPKPKERPKYPLLARACDGAPLPLGLAARHHTITAHANSSPPHICSQPHTLDPAPQLHHLQSIDPGRAAKGTTPCVTFRLVDVRLRGPGQSPVLPFACCVGSLRSVGRCGRCSCWCRFRVRGAQWLVCWGCAECGMVCCLRISDAQ